MIKKNVLHKFPEDVVHKIPGQLTDRRTLLGELNWVFTAITDTIAWNCLPRDTFQRLYRQVGILISFSFFKPLFSTESPCTFTKERIN